jgi:hypothetical protein
MARISAQTQDIARRCIDFHTFSPKMAHHGAADKSRAPQNSEFHFRCPI